MHFDKALYLYVFSVNPDESGTGLRWELHCNLRWTGVHPGGAKDSHPLGTMGTGHIHRSYAPSWHKKRSKLNNRLHQVNLKSLFFFSGTKINNRIMKFCTFNKSILYSVC